MLGPVLGPKQHKIVRCPQNCSKRAKLAKKEHLAKRVSYHFRKKVLGNQVCQESPKRAKRAPKRAPKSLPEAIKTRVNILTLLSKSDPQNYSKLSADNVQKRFE